jgi:hypothetical protein
MWKTNTGGESDPAMLLCVIREKKESSFFFENYISDDASSVQNVRCRNFVRRPMPQEIRLSTGTFEMHPALGLGPVRKMRRANAVRASLSKKIRLQIGIFDMHPTRQEKQESGRRAESTIHRASKQRLEPATHCEASRSVSRQRLEPASHCEAPSSVSNGRSEPANTDSKRSPDS